MQASEWVRRVRNLAQKVTLRERKEDDLVEVETSFGRSYELRELKPYGLGGKPEKGHGICLFIGGDVRSPVLLPFNDADEDGKREGHPDLADGEVALYSQSGNRVVLRSDGSVELNGTDYGGLVKWQELQTQLSKVDTFLQTLQQTLGAKPPVNEPGNGAPSVLQTALKTAIGTLALPDYTQVENDKVVHGGKPGEAAGETKSQAGQDSQTASSQNVTEPQKQAKQDVKDDAIAQQMLPGALPLDFTTADAAASHWAKRYLAMSVERDLEFGSTIYEEQDKHGRTRYVYTTPAVGGQHGVNPSKPSDESTLIADIHTHGAESPDYYDETFSPSDKVVFHESLVYGYLATPSGLIRKYSYKSGKEVIPICDIWPNIHAVPQP